MNPYDENQNHNTNDETRTPAQPTAQPSGTANIASTTSTTNTTGAPGAYPYTAQTGAPRYTPGQYTPYQQSQAVYQQPQPQQPQPRQSSYSWGPAAPQTAYYQPQQRPAKKKRSGGRFVLKAIAAVLVCAMVSLGSVGVFAAMIQNGVVNIQAPQDSEETAAFTLYKRAESETGASAAPASTKGGLTTQEIAQKIIPSVVCVQNYQIVQQQNDLFGYFFSEGREEQSGDLSPVGEGSGIIISKDGYIVTNQHVISNADRISVVSSDGTTYDAELIGEDSQTDLAVIKITTDDELTPAEFGSSGDLQVTDQVLAVGNPGGLQFNSSVTIGYVSALNRPVTNSDTGYIINCIQTDAAINPGNSGGALVNSDGLVVGINSSKIAATDYEGMGFAIPSDLVQPIVSDLIDYGYVRDRAMLGITGAYLDRSMATFYGLPQGYCVGELVTASAKASGLQERDFITAIDGTQVVAENTISSYLATKKPGDKVTLTVDRPLTGETGIKVELTLSANTGSNN